MSGMAPSSNRPPISLTSPSTFVRSVYVRFIALWTPSFVRSILYGQVLSIALTLVSVLTTELVDRNWVLPSTQVFFSYAFIFIVYTTYTVYKYGLKGWCKLLVHDGWKYLILTLGDFEAGYLYTKSFGYTDLMSCMLLDAWTIPVCMLVCWAAMHVRYHWTQILGVAICIGGLALLVTSDLLTGKNGSPTRSAEGDGFMLAASTLYGFVNAAEEFYVRRSPLYEVLGQMGLWGMVASSVQALILERQKWKTSTWDGAIAGLLVGNTISVFVMYTLQMMLFRVASSPYFNISLLTSDFYGLLFGLFLFHYSPYWLYFVAFAIVISGLVIYFWHATPEEQGTTKVELPKYLQAEGKSTMKYYEGQKLDCVQETLIAVA
ncbi:solute carrier family 35 member SLC35F1/F2/F6 [Pisolithus thermaeus]|nr:solute carrier family 35 member SLC35F1/F2/F6 [Pisolithus croceorrhizus]KAI6166089.1 solute carrier family 35 member SLC35F1/F2/F6 [Pisolithus thermaeus]